MQKKLIDIHNLTRGYDSSSSFVFQGFSMSLQKGDFTVVSGKSGTGKTSLINLIIGQSQAPQSSVYHRGEDISSYSLAQMQSYRRNIGIIFQDYKLEEGLTVQENVSYPLQILNMQQEDVDNKVHRIINKLNLGKYADEKVKYLSGGSKQKVCIARALVNNPEFIIADEATGNLDREDTKNIADMFLDLNKNGITILLVTHDVHLIEYLKFKNPELKLLDL